MNLFGKPCEYIGEGNAHIVLRVVGTGYVLRLLKSDKDIADLSSVQTSTAFVNTVMIPLLANNSYGQNDVIEIPANEIAEISDKLEAVRPKKRKIKSKLCRFAVKAPNLLVLYPSSSTNYCIEIKPKEGFMSSSLQESLKCYYCLKQFLKLSEKQISKLSEYCPLDLFSGDRRRMRCALWNVIKNPQNNFKIFSNEIVIFGENSSEDDFYSILNSIECFENSTILFLEFIIAILLNDNNNCEITFNRTEEIVIKSNKSEKCIDDSNKLPLNSFLQKLLLIQKLSETCDIEYEKLVSMNTEYVPSILQQIKSQNLDLNCPMSADTFLSTSDPVHLALISAVAKDCSIMISFTDELVKDFPTIKIGKHEVSYRVAITDLEPKSVTSLTKRKATERKMLEIYQTCMEATKMNKFRKYHVVECVIKRGNLI